MSRYGSAFPTLAVGLNPWLTGRELGLLRACLERVGRAVIPCEPVTADLLEVPCPEPDAPAADALLEPRVPAWRRLPGSVRAPYAHAAAAIRAADLVLLRCPQTRADYRPELACALGRPVLAWSCPEQVVETLGALEIMLWSGSTHWWWTSTRSE
jgi:hypothetical protein